MRYLKTKTIILAAPVVMLGFFFIASCATGQKVTPVIPLPLTKPADGARLVPGPNDSRIAYVTARLLEQNDFTQRHLDSELSKRFFDGYLDSLDSRHENFLQSDLAEFDHYRTNLDKLTDTLDGVANLTPAFQIFNRFLERLQQHNDYVMALLKQDHFKFNTEDRIAIDRRHEPYPRDLAAAEALWGQQLRFEFLIEKLSQEISVTNGNLVVKLPKTAETNIIDTLTRRYQRNQEIFTKWDGTDVLQAYLNGLTHAYDPHSDYFNPEHAADFNIQMNLSLFGIGAQLSESDGGFCTIEKLIAGGPADRSKQLNEKDRVVAVAQGTNPPVNVVGMELGKVVQLIRGAKGTEVRLTISPAVDRAARNIVALVRDEIKLDDQAARAKLIDLPDGKGGTTRLGYILLPSFYAPVGGSGGGRATPQYTSVDVAKLVNKLKQEKVNGIILDLRNNPGGSLEEAVRFTSLFIKDGPVVQARSADGISVDSDTDQKQIYDGPLAVMINRFSASASEIAAAALQDYGRAIVVGDSSTFGKGTVQSLYPLHPYVWTATNDPGELKVTIRKFYRISGGSTQFKGVASDIILPDPLDYRTDIESESTLENALPWDTIPSATYTKFDLVQPYLAELSKRSAVRTATNQDFVYLRQEIEETKKLNTDHSLTLNENEAIQERRTNQAKDKARAAERDTRPPADLTVYDLFLTNTLVAGLPAPSYYPGMLETNATSTTTTTFKPVLNEAIPLYSAADKKLAESLGLDLDTGRFHNGFNAQTNLVPVTATAKNPGLEKATLTVATYTNSTVTVSTATIKLKNQPDLDPILLETDNIMVDYISLLAPKGVLSKN
jgi:carboxyl-terminal processing protease